MSYKKEYTEEDLKAFELKDHKILVQNLLNRATEIEIHNAATDTRQVCVKNIQQLLSQLGNIAHQSIEKKKDQLGIK